MAFPQSPKKSRILFLLDASSSMTLNWNPAYSRFDIASNILLKIIDSVYAVNNEIEFAVRAYGTQYAAQEKNCTDTRLEVPFNMQNVGQIKTRLSNIKPVGFSPIAYSLRQASDNELSDAALYDYSIIFITDGGESCLGDVCKTYQEFLAKKIKVKPYIIGLDRNEQLDKLYSCMGSFIGVKDSADINIAVKMIVDANRLLLEKPKLFNLPTVFANPPVIKDSSSEPAPKPPVVVKKSNNPFPRLIIVPYRSKQKGVFMMKPTYLILKKQELVTLHMKTDEEPPPPLKKSEVMVRIFPNPYSGKKNTPPSIGAKAFAYNNQQKAVLKFDFETPPAPVVKISTVLPRIQIGTSKNTFAKSTAKITPPVFFTDNSKKGILRFEVEEPVKRITQVLPFITTSKLVYTKAANKYSFNPKLYVLSNNEKAILRLEYEEPIKRVNNIIPKINAQLFAYKKTKNNNAISAKSFSFKNETAILRFEVEERKKTVMLPIIPQKASWRVSYGYRLPSDNNKVIFPKGKAIIRFADEAAIAKKKDTVKKIVVPQTQSGNNSEFNIETENSEETTVQIFFKGANGKNYPTATPEIQFNDISTKQTLTSFRRQVSGGEPLPQKVEPGKYNVVVSGYNSLYLNNVNIEPNKLNKVIIKVTEGTLSFAYIGNRNRPIEYNAIVNRRFAAGATILQKCTDRLPYEPGTYYVEINTMPASKFSIDMSFGALYELQIPEPGKLQFTNTEPVGKVQLQCMLGDQFVVFHTMTLDGNVNNQKLDMQPGLYKVIFPVDPRMPQMGSKTLDFTIKSNLNTLVELK